MRKRKSQKELYNPKGKSQGKGMETFCCVRLRVTGNTVRNELFGRVHASESICKFTLVVGSRDLLCFQGKREGKL